MFTRCRQGTWEALLGWGSAAWQIRDRNLDYGKESQQAGAGTGFSECYLVPGRETEERTVQNSSLGLQQQGQHLTTQKEGSAGWLCGTRAKQVAGKKLRQVAGEKLRQQRRKEPCVQNRSSKCKSKTRKYFTSFINPLETAGQRAVLINSRTGKICRPFLLAPLHHWQPYR